MTRLICWDLDETLGNFRALEKGENDIFLRKGIQTILEKISSKSILNILTTSASEKYARKALDQTGLNAYFEEIFAGDFVMGWMGKKYRHILDLYQIPPKIAGDKFLVVGDAIQDKPLDVSGLVFLMDNTFREKNCDAANLGMILNQLTKYESFWDSFEEMYHQSKPHPEGYRVYSHPLCPECFLNHIEYEEDVRSIKINLMLLSCDINESSTPPPFQSFRFT